MIPVDLNITSLVKTDEGEDKIEFFTVGTYKSTRDGYCLSYDETGDIGYDNNRVMITAKGESVVIERKGDAPSTLCIEKNIKHHCVYGTPYGDIMMGINTYAVNNSLGKNGGKLYFRYSIDINSDFVSENEMDIDVKPSLEA